jgi:8-oxo-dGTP pyrophosphatase MutT (NUDIX family)
MIKEKSAGAVILRKDGSRILYLLLHYKHKSDYWDFTKGNIEQGEREEETVKREVLEETGLNDISFIQDFEESTNWFYKRDDETVFKEVVYFLVETKSETVRISEEHIGHEWLSFTEALKRITYNNSKEILRKANEFLLNHPSLMEFFKKD